MLFKKKISKQFFEKERENAPKNTLKKDVIPLNLDNEKELIKGTKKIIVSLPKK